jgi:hypothetical protein
VRRGNLPGRSELECFFMSNAIWYHDRHPWIFWFHCARRDIRRMSSERSGHKLAGVAVIDKYGVCKGSELNFALSSHIYDAHFLFHPAAISLHKDIYGSVSCSFWSLRASPHQIDVKTRIRVGIQRLIGANRYRWVDLTVGRVIIPCLHRCEPRIGLGISRVFLGIVVDSLKFVPQSCYQP